MDPVRLPLKSPVKLTESSPEITELVFSRRPIARDFKGMPGVLAQDHNQEMMSRLTNTELAVIEKLDAHDYLRACGVLELFLGAGPETGKKSSGNCTWFFRFPPSEVWGFSVDDLAFWSQRMAEISETLNRR